MRALVSPADQLLRGVGQFDPDALLERSVWLLPLLILAFSPIYGAFMGSYNFIRPDRVLQIVYSAAKMPILLFGTAAVCLPAFFVLNTVLGLRNDLREALHAILAGQAGLSIALASLSPFTRFIYFSSADYRLAQLFNASMFTLATVAGQILMIRYYRVLFRRNRNHRIAFCAWLILYVFVGIQMGWVLRPFIGAPSVAVTFFRAEPFTNAYIVIFNLIFPE